MASQTGWMGFQQARTGLPLGLLANPVGRFCFPSGRPHRFFFNLNISRYISTATAEKEIILETVNAELVDIEHSIQKATAKHNEFLKELGLPLLPSANGD